MTKAKCPVPVLSNALGAPIEAAKPALRAAAFTARAWNAANLGKRLIGMAMEGPATADPPPPPRPVAPRPLRWVSHAPLTAGRLTLCARCGSAPTAREPGRMEARPCPGMAYQPPALIQALNGGRFDRALAAASEATRALARAHGWSPLPPPPPPPEPPAQASDGRPGAPPGGAVSLGAPPALF